MPSPQSMIGRRALLTTASRGALGVLGATLVAGSASACGKFGKPEIDPLQTQLDLATADAELARNAAASAPAAARALTRIAAERDEHARALANEIARASGAKNLPSTGASAAPTTTGTRVPSPGVDDVVAALRRSATSAAQLVPTLAGYRAGLLGSIAAACTASYTVSLRTQGPS